MPKNRVLSTRVLLICAAVGVATGLVSAGAGYLSIIVSAGAPVLYGLVLGSHVLPGILAQSLLRVPGVALITHVLAALVSTAFAPAWVLRYIGTALLIGVIQEGITAIGRYRYWGLGRFMISAVIVGVLLAVPISFAADIDKFEPWAFVLYLVMFIVGPVAWTFIGVRIGSALRRAGVVTRV
ncbi:ECF transporter S component [Microbacterium sp.]|uniref:ECF transporter S component n=1 Tax=Microbacterium sp. TaxID=51671 RepID=UPI0027362D58|nr:ECF transporter S component [Microbacterium sp.]MDP3952422.1 ECF transporter S component [Microbacterium sp.]